MYCVAVTSCMQFIFWPFVVLTYLNIQTVSPTEMKKNCSSKYKNPHLYVLQSPHCTHTLKQNVHKATHQQDNANTNQSVHELKTFSASVYPIKFPGIHTVSFLTFGTLGTKNRHSNTSLRKLTQT